MNSVQNTQSHALAFIFYSTEIFLILKCLEISDFFYFWVFW